MSASIHPSQSPIQVAKNLDLSLDVKRDFGASGSDFTTTGTMTAGSAMLTLAAGGDFQNGQGIAIIHAGAGPYQTGTTTTLVAPTSPAVTNEGTAGTTSYTYYISALDENGGITTAVSVSTTTGNAALSHSATGSNYNYLTWTASAGAFGYAIWGDTTNPTSSQGLLGLTGSTHFLDMGLGPAGMGMGEGFTASDLIPSSPPSSALGGTLLTTISAGAGSTTLVLSDSAVNAVSGTLVTHDDSTPLSNALATIVDQGGGTLDFQDGTFYVASGLTTTITAPDVHIRLRGVSSSGHGGIVAIPGYTGSVIDITGYQETDSDKTTAVVIEGLNIDGNKSNQPFGTNEDAQCGIRLVQCAHCLVTGNLVHHTWMSPIRLGNGTGTIPTSPSVIESVVSNNRVYEGYDQGIAIWNSEHISVVGNTVARSGWAGISITQSNRCVVSSNTSNNNFYFVNYPNVEGHGIAIEGGDSNTIEGNTAKGSNAEQLHMNVGPFSGVICTNNAITGNTFVGSVMAQGIVVDSSEQTTITGNAINGNATEGIYVGTHAYNTTITGNVVNNNGASGMILYGPTGPTTIADNVIMNNTGRGLHIGVGGSSTDFSVRGNVCVGNNDSQINIANATNFSVSGNQVSWGSSTAGSNGIFVSNAEYGIIDANVVVGSSNSAQGILLMSSEHLTVSHNFVTGSGGNANIDCRGVSESQFLGNRAMNGRGNPGLLLEDNGSTYCLNNLVQGNYLVDDQGTPTQSYGFEETGNTNYSSVNDNYANGNTAADYSFVGPQSTSRNNIPRGTIQNPQTLAGTAGSIAWTMPDQGTRKVFFAVANAYENDSTTNQTITFPTSFTYSPVITTNTTGLTLTVSTTELTITAPGSTTTYSGVIEVVGM